MDAKSATISNIRMIIAECDIIPHATLLAGLAGRFKSTVNSYLFATQ